jgi:hypothetical protein
LGVANQFDNYGHRDGQGSRHGDPAVKFAKPFAPKFCHLKYLFSFVGLQFFS